jgi:hypothetical protein
VCGKFVLLRVIFAWVCLYVLSSWALSTVFATVASFYSIFSTQYSQNILSVLYFGFALVLICIGIASLLPFSEYSYMRGGASNPAIARESVERQRKGRQENKKLGFLMGIVGLTSVIGLNPGYVFFFSLPDILGMYLTTILMWIILMILAVFYKKKLHEYVKSTKPS